WSTTRDDIAAGNPYPLWNSPGNELHALQWRYVDHCVELLAIAKRYAEGDEARKYAKMASDLFQPALHSCQFWWASRRPTWDPGMIYRGFQLLNAVVVHASHAINTGTASTGVRRRAGWRVAAANEERWLIGRYVT